MCLSVVCVCVCEVMTVCICGLFPLYCLNVHLSSNKLSLSLSPSLKVIVSRPALTDFTGSSANKSRSSHSKAAVMNEEDCRK